MHVTSDDPWQLTAALGGDESCWIRIVEEFSATVWHWSRSYGLTREEAEDVAQNVWYKLKERGEDIADRRRLPGWLATTTRREALSMLRHRARTVAVGDDVLVDLHDRAPEAPVAAMVEVNDMNARIVDAFRTLNDACRELLALCWKGSLSYEQIADSLGRSTGSIGPTRQRCLSALRARAGLT